MQEYSDDLVKTLSNLVLLDAILIGFEHLSEK